MHSRPSVKHVLGVLELSYVVPEKGDKDPSGLKVLANKTNSEVSKPLVAVEKSHHHHHRK